MRGGQDGGSSRICLSVLKFLYLFARVPITEVPVWVEHALFLCLSSLPSLLEVGNSLQGCSGPC